MATEPTPHDLDTDGNGCRQREDAMRRDLTKVTVAEGGCSVLTGTLHDPWTGRTVQVRSGREDVRVAQVVPLADAWAKGAQEWSPGRRTKFATDLLNLQVVATGEPDHGDATEWLPEATKDRCGYVARQVAVKQRYGLTVTPAERAAMGVALTECPKTKLPRQTVVLRTD